MQISFRSIVSGLPVQFHYSTHISFGNPQASLSEKVIASDCIFGHGMHTLLTSVTGSQHRCLCQFHHVEIVPMMQLMLGVVASAIGAALAVAYIGLKGNSHAGWNKVANAGYDKFIKHTATAIALSIFAVTDLVTLTMHSTYTLYKGVRDQIYQAKIQIPTA